MQKYAPLFSRIYNLLNENSSGMTIREVSESIGVNRISTAKYLGLLQVQGMVDVRQRGSAKFFFPSHRFPFSSIQRFIRDWYLLFDHGGYIAAIHPDFLKALHLSAPGVLGKRINALGIPETLDPAFLAEIKETIRGHEPQERDLAFTILERRCSFHVIFVPVIFGAGKAGGGIILREKQELPAWDLPSVDIPGSYSMYISPEGRILAANDTCATELGRPKEEIIGAPCRAFILKEDWPLLARYAGILTPENPVAVFEVRTLRPSGRMGWLRTINRAVYNDAGTLLGYLSLNIDITSRKRKEEQIRKYQDSLEKKIETQDQELQEFSRQLTRQIADRDILENQLRLTQFTLDLSPDLILWISPDGRVIYANPPVLGLLGYTVQMITCLSWDDVALQSAGCRWSDIWSVTKENLQLVRRTNLVKANGVKNEVETHFRYLNYGSREYCFCYVRDIPKKNEGMQKEGLLEDHLSAILDGIPDAVVVLNTEKKVIVWNRALEKLTGVPAREMLGKGDGDHAVPVYGDRSGMLLDLIFGDNPSVRKKYQFINRFGESLLSEKFFPKFLGREDRSLRFTAFPVRGKEGEFIGAFEIIQDITFMEFPGSGEMKNSRICGKDPPQPTVALPSTPPENSRNDPGTRT